VVPGPALSASAPRPASNLRFGSSWVWFPIGCQYLATIDPHERYGMLEGFSWHHDYVMQRKTPDSGWEVFGDPTTFLASITASAVRC
jgi:hypothetical protein